MLLALMKGKFMPVQEEAANVLVSIGKGSPSLFWPIYFKALSHAKNDGNLYVFLLHVFIWFLATDFPTLPKVTYSTQDLITESDDEVENIKYGKLTMVCTNIKNLKTLSSVALSEFSNVGQSLAMHCIEVCYFHLGLQ